MQWTHQRGASTLRDRKAAALHPPNLAFRPFAASPTAVFRHVSRRVGARRRPSSTPSSSPPPCAHRRAQIRTLATSLKSAFVVPWRVGPYAACRSCRAAVSVQHLRRRVFRAADGRLGSLTGRCVPAAARGHAWEMAASLPSGRVGAGVAQVSSGGARIATVSPTA